MTLASNIFFNHASQEAFINLICHLYHVDILTTNEYIKIFINNSTFMKKKPKKDEYWSSWRIVEKKEYSDWRFYIHSEPISNNKEEIKLKKKFWDKLKKVRLQRNISQEELAYRARLHRTYVSDVERGKINISLENIGKLAKALKIHIHTLMNFSDND